MPIWHGKYKLKDQGCWNQVLAHIGSKTMGGGCERGDIEKRSRWGVAAGKEKKNQKNNAARSHQFGMLKKRETRTEIRKKGNRQKKALGGGKKNPGERKKRGTRGRQIIKNLEKGVKRVGRKETQLHAKGEWQEGGGGERALRTT